MMFVLLIRKLRLIVNYSCTQTIMLIEVYHLFGIEYPESKRLEKHCFSVNVYIVCVVCDSFDFCRGGGSVRYSYYIIIL